MKSMINLDPLAVILVRSLLVVRVGRLNLTLAIYRSRSVSRAFRLKFECWGHLNNVLRVRLRWAMVTTCKFVGVLPGVPFPGMTVCPKLRPVVLPKCLRLSGIGCILLDRLILLKISRLRGSGWPCRSDTMVVTNVRLEVALSIPILFIMPRNILRLRAGTLLR